MCPCAPSFQPGECCVNPRHSGPVPAFALGSRGTPLTQVRRHANPPHQPPLPLLRTGARGYYATASNTSPEHPGGPSRALATGQGHGPHPSPGGPRDPSGLPLERCETPPGTSSQGLSATREGPRRKAPGRRDPPPLPPPFPGPGFWEPFRHHRASKAQAPPHQRVQNPGSPVTFHLQRGSPLPFSPGFRGNKDPLSP